MRSASLLLMVVALHCCLQTCAPCLVLSLQLMGTKEDLSVAYSPGGSLTCLSEIVPSKFSRQQPLCQL
jgi:hypothetical protein